MLDTRESSSLIVHRSSLAELWLALADDEFVTGYANSEWTGIAPILEEDIAFSSLAQDELGHAKLYYQLLSELQVSGVSDQGSGSDESLMPDPRSLTPDAIAYGRPPEGFRNARLVELPRGDWAYSVTRQFLYDTADYVRLECLRGSAYTPLANAAASIVREEKYHLLHAQTWLDRLAGGGPEARGRQREALEALWPDALGLFEPIVGEPELVAAKILPEPFAALRDRWLSVIAARLRRLELPFPFVERDGGWEPLVEPRYGGRRGQHGASFLELYDTITSVYRLDPGASW